MNFSELKEKYAKIPNELKIQKRWCLYKLIKKDDGSTTKIPLCSMTGKGAKSNDSNTWSNFEIACMGGEKYQADGLGFMLGDGFFGIDLDNHYGENGELETSQEDMKSLIDEFTTQLHSYTEYSQSGNGIHIICKGYLPDGGNRQGNVEMYNTFRFFAMTGNQYPNSSCEIKDCSEKVVPLFNKYIKLPTERKQQAKIQEFAQNNTFTFGNNKVVLENEMNSLVNYKKLSDSEVLDIIKEKASDVWAMLGGFRRVSDESANDQSLMNHLAFWTNKDTGQMIRIFEGSSYFMSKDDPHKEKWLNRRDYKIRTIQNAINNVQDTYKQPIKEEKKQVYINAPVQPVMSTTFIDKNGVINMDINNKKFNAKNKKIFQEFGFSDTENAKHFFAYYGEIIRYNIENEKFLIWNGKTWDQDSKEHIEIKRLVDEFIGILKDEIDLWSKQRKELEMENEEGSKDAEIAAVDGKIKNAYKNIQRIENREGKNALINELKHLGHLPIKNNELDNNDLELNTPSGIVDLKTGEIRPHTVTDYNTLLTSVGVCKKEPSLWLHFLDTTWTHPTITNVDKEELIHFFQKYIGYCLTGKKNYEICVTLYGNGSNGKSVILGVLNHIFGSYQKPIKSQIIANTGSNTGNMENSIANLNNIRLGLINELKSNATINAPFVKQITSHDEQMEGRFLYGNSFFFYPKFKPIIITNHKPKIVDTDNGIWRRMCAIPFPNDFENRSDKDINLNEKLEKEWSSILWWAIQGAVMYQKEGLEIPNCIKAYTQEYRNDMDVVAQFIDSECDTTVGKDYTTLSGTVMEAFKNWCLRSNIDSRPYDSKFLKRELGKKGYVQKRTSGGNAFLGLKLNKDKKGHSFADMLGE